MRSVSGFNNAAVQGSFDSRSLNKLGSAIDMASTNYSNDIQYTEAVGGTSYGLSQQVWDGNPFYGNNGYIPQFGCYVFEEINTENPSGDPFYFLRISKGNVTYTYSYSFPFTQGTYSFGVSEVPSLIFTGNQVCVFDAAITPQGSRTSGTDINSIWFAENGKYLLDKNVGSYYVTISYLDYTDQLSWFPDEAIIHTGKPWVSIVPSTGPSKTAIFSTCTTTMMADYINLGSWDGTNLGPKGSMGLFPTQIGYTMKVIARINWDSTNKAWTVVQELVGPITFDQPPMVHNVVGANNDIDTSFYNNQVSSQFSSTIVNPSYVNTVFKEATFSDSDILNPATSEWWYDVKTV